MGGKGGSMPAPPPAPKPTVDPLVAKMQKMIDEMKAGMNQAVATRMEAPVYTKPSGPTPEELAKEHYQQQIDQMLTARNGAWTQAGETLNTQIADEQSRASLYGMDAAPITDEIRNSRQQDLFAGYWDAGQEAELESLIGKYGSSSQEGMFKKYVRGRSPKQLKAAADAAKLVIAGASVNNTSSLLKVPDETLASGGLSG